MGLGALMLGEGEQRLLLYPRVLGAAENRVERRDRRVALDLGEPEDRLLPHFRIRIVPRRLDQDLLHAFGTSLSYQEDRFLAEAGRTGIAPRQHLLQDRPGPLRVHVDQRVDRRDLHVVAVVVAAVRHLVIRHVGHVVIRDVHIRHLAVHGGVVGRLLDLRGRVRVAQAGELAVDPRLERLGVALRGCLGIALGLDLQRLEPALQVGFAAQPVEGEGLPVAGVGCVTRFRVLGGHLSEEIRRPPVVALVERGAGGAVERIGGVTLQPGGGRHVGTRGRVLDRGRGALRENVGGRSPSAEPGRGGQCDSERQTKHHSAP